MKSICGLSDKKNGLEDADLFTEFAGFVDFLATKQWSSVDLPFYIHFICHITVHRPSIAPASKGVLLKLYYYYYYYY